MVEQNQMKDNLKRTAQWLLEHRGFLESLLFEAISLSTRLGHLEYEDKHVSGLGAKFYVNFISPTTEDDYDGSRLDIVTLEFNIARHGIIDLTYENIMSPEPVIERVMLLVEEDCSHLEGPCYDDLESIRWAIIDRLMTIAEGKQISNYGILNASNEEKLRFTKEVEKRHHDFMAPFNEPCRFGGFCTDEDLYESCINDSRMKNNWMCWRDGILLKDEGPLEMLEAEG